jgi:hypothetical protein
MRGASRTGDKIFLRIGELLKPFRLISFCHWCAPDNPLTLGCNAERGDSCRFSAPTYSSKITGLKENFSTPDISSPDCMWALGLPVLSSRATPDAAQVAVVERVCRVKSFEVASGGEH